ncbi:beta-ketoacyl-[acyl-carrier-protein] synthase family protein [Ktedonosporobacter rubrisoli]|uniref:Beta-ketoacyl-[acyl-carrier-protein] synthase family protein n=1 Tax=Ktedonosporobacter rubrisoli TaxID=2509675 RepID=A0A4P6JNK3_KTERU|nr:beta-ketoacyl-[acyl-carrier-protein] synthase family protein [Ktedonosporobacter rubrisoli]QBD76897.1 beta-ketoacyl-[acyl-carrier-protein] synthase family protein [Ktedonosporobacter rubrisoli]
MVKEVVITGIGGVAPAGIGVTNLWHGLRSGQSFITPITRFETTRFFSKLAGSVDQFQPADFLDPRIIVQTDRWTQFDLVCSMEAIQTAGLCISNEDQQRIGAVFAAGTGGNEFGQQQLHICHSQGPAFVSTYLAIAWFYAASLGQVSIGQHIRGYGRTICADAAGGLIALAHGAKIIQQDICDVVIVSGCEAPLAPYTFASLQASGLLSSATGQFPYCPFDSERDGVIVGEGGAAFCLESKERAIKRNAHIYAEIAGWGQSFDGIVTREPASDGVQYARALAQAIELARLKPRDVDWVVCDGLGTQGGDISEVKALQAVFGSHLAATPASAPKSMLGRLFNGASTVDTLIAILGLEHNLLLPTIGYLHPDPRCPIDCVPNQPRQQSLQHVLVGSRGFGGFNAALLLRRPS